MCVLLSTSLFLTQLYYMDNWREYIVTSFGFCVYNTVVLDYNYTPIHHWIMHNGEVSPNNYYFGAHCVCNLLLYWRSMAKVREGVFKMLAEYLGRHGFKYFLWDLLLWEISCCLPKALHSNRKLTVSSLFL